MLDNPLANLRVAAENPRKTPADEAAHLSLVASMKAHGQITNILVRPGDKPDLFDIIDGGRRFQAAKAAEGSVARTLTLLGGDALKLHQRTAAATASASCL